MPGRRRGPGGRDGSSFNPKLIFAQIISLQCFHYLALAFLFQLNYVFYGKSITIDRIFTDRYLQLWSFSGLPDNFAIILSSCVGAVLMTLIVEKSKKCLDFSVTLFLIHLIACSLYNGFPGSWDWWIINILATITMTLLGEYLCSRRELDEIPLLVL